jgi:hypothetical protein
MIYCTVEDVQLLNQQRGRKNSDGEFKYTTQTKPTRAQVKQVIVEASADLDGLVYAAGYDIDNLFETSDAVSSTETVDTYETYPSSYDMKVHLSSYTSGDYAVGDTVYIGNSSISNRYVISDITSLLPDGFKLISSEYDSFPASSVVYKFNNALHILRRLCALRSAAEAERATFMGMNPNKSEHADELDKKADEMLKRIQTVQGYLRGATQNNFAKSDETMTSYHVENPGDDVVENQPEFGLDTKW